MRKLLEIIKAITTFIFTFAISISALGDTANIFDGIP